MVGVGNATVLPSFARNAATIEAESGRSFLRYVAAFAHASLLRRRFRQHPLWRSTSCWGVRDQTTDGQPDEDQTEHSPNAMVGTAHTGHYEPVATTPDDRRRVPANHLGRIPYLWVPKISSLAAELGRCISHAPGQRRSLFEGVPGPLDVGRDRKVSNPSKSRQAGRKAASCQLFAGTLATHQWQYRPFLFGLQLCRCWYRR
jgi:hypothetical protein